MHEDQRYIFTIDDFDIRIGPFQAIGFGNQFGYRLWNEYLDRSSGSGGPFKTEGEAYLAGEEAALKEAERLNLLP